MPVCFLSFSKPIMHCLSLKAFPSQWPCWAFPSQFGIGLFQTHVGLGFSKPICQVQPAFSKTRGPAVFSKTTEHLPPPGKHPQLSKRWGRPPWLPSSVRPGKHQCPRPHIPGRYANCHQKWQQHPTARQDLPSHPHHISSSRFLFQDHAGECGLGSWHPCPPGLAFSWRQCPLQRGGSLCSVPAAFPSLSGCPGSQHHPFPRCCASQPPPQAFPSPWWHCHGWCCPGTFPNPWAWTFPSPGQACSSFFAFLFQGGCWLFQARRRACSSRGEHSLPWLATLAPVLGAPYPGLIRGGELFQFLGNSICHPLLAPGFCLFQGFQVLGQDSGVSWVCLFQGWPLHPLPSFLPGLGSGPMTKLPPLFVGGPFRLVHLFQDFPVQVGFSNPLSFSKPSLRDQAFPNPKPCFSSRAFPSPPTATSYKWCCSCMCWLWSLVTSCVIVVVVFLPTFVVGEHVYACASCVLCCASCVCVCM